jgi:hypothetical protein
MRHLNVAFLYSVFAVVLCYSAAMSGGSKPGNLRSVDAVNSLSVLDPAIYGSKPGYIDQAVLVVEPHGAYAEQSLYITYSDHAQFESSSKLEIVHRFELPQGAAINDLWLWIGDSVMQAIVIDTWTGRHIYDSIVSKHRDPAFLAKTGDQYELHIYPLTPGSYRKIKMNYIVPTQWSGTNGTVPLPVRFLGANNATTRPLDILFREREDVWGSPSITEDTSLHFASIRDTLGYRFRRATVGNIVSSQSLHIGFSSDFSSGVFFSSNEKPGQPTDFQLGLIPEQIFDLRPDSSARKVYVGVDLSGSNYNKLPVTLANIDSLLHTSLRDRDSVQIIVAGAGTEAMLNTSPTSASAPGIDTMLARFQRSSLARVINSIAHKRLLFSDNLALTCWAFQGIDSLATITMGNSLWDVKDQITKVDIVAAYSYGYEQIDETAAHRDGIIARLDSLFLNGGRFLGYFDYNRAKSKDSLGSHYFPGLTTNRRIDGSATLYRNDNGNIGRYFPEQVIEYGFDILSYTPDSSIKVELADASGGPVVISKQVGKGLIVISSIWSFRDDDAIKKILSVPLLGLTSISNGPEMLPSLLASLRTMNNSSPANEILVFSNGDSLTPVASSQSWTSLYLGGFVGTAPQFVTVNLLDGRVVTPPYLTQDLIQYFGSGYLMKSLSSATGGTHYETHLTDWAAIRSALGYNANHPISRLQLGVVVDDGAGLVTETREVNPDVINPLNARFFIGATNAQSSISCNLTAWVTGLADSQIVSKKFLLSHDSTKNETVIPVMLANEQVNDIFLHMAQTSNPDTADTIAIVKIAIKNRLLCDFTAMLALEPNDTLHFLRNPFDESGLVSGVADDVVDDADSIEAGVFPNPFNSTTTLTVRTKRFADIRLEIYNILGQKMAEYEESNASPGLHMFHWNGTNIANQSASSGIYFARFAVKNLVTGRVDFRIKKILLVQ